MIPLTAIFQQILSMSLTGAVVIAVVCALRLCLKWAPKKFSYWLWTAAAFRLVCPFSFSWMFSLFSMTSMETVSAPGPVTQASYLPGIYQQLEKVLPKTAAPPGEPIYAAGAPIPGADALRPAEPGWFAVLAALWIVGAAAFLGAALVSRFRIRRKVSTAVLRETNIYESDAIRSPFVLGIFRPRVYIPFGLSDLQRDYVLRHEACHIRRKDHWVKPLAFLILAVHWFNPMVWLAFRLMSRDMEMSCDEKALNGLGEDARRAYSLSLLSFAENRRFPSPNFPAFGETEIQGRIKNVLTFRKAGAGASLAAALVCVLVGAACAANPAAVQEVPNPPGEELISLSPAPSGPEIVGRVEEADEGAAPLQNLPQGSPAPTPEVLPSPAPGAASAHSVE